ncbi:SDR family NAD(P)-dependent oxidoreductase [Kitasatospora sp. NPDC097691]|uniref:SDR family NAD(P)-dependent oxidoreductase n=1 Tax=Kitasatospora sp. NPDC097691 TaxID=3157231 RepID=UPI0033207211
MNVSGKRILITGGTSGVGDALARALVDAGARVVTCGRRSDPDVPEVPDSGGRVAASGPERPERPERTERPERHAAARPERHAVIADLAMPGEAARVVRLAAGQLGGLDAVVANAGVQHLDSLTGGPSPELLDRAEQEIAVNFRSVVELAAASWPHLAAAGGPAAFVAVTSGLAYAPKRSAPVYCATKAAVHTLVQSLRYQAQADTPSVRVQEVVLPLVDTAMTADREGAVRKLSAAEAAAAIVRGIRRGRPLVPIGASRALLALLRVHPPIAHRILRDG